METVQGTLKSLLKHQCLKASTVQCSVFFIVQLSHPYMTTVKAKALTGRAFDGKLMSVLFNMGSRLFITLLPRSKCLLISWLQSPSAVILEPQKLSPLGNKRKSLDSPLDYRRSNQSILKEISPECSLEGLMLKLKLQYLDHLM